ncbi:MAG TPA: hypothetical protein VM598_06970, partial [Bdellovibrionota bacterium]|nr:hypothetical protein [Bdellovibrionota bacterium]
MRARILAVASAVSFVLFTPSAMAGAKVAIAASTVQVLKSAATAGGGSEWRTIIPSSIATSNGKTLVLGVSLECGLYTNTVTKSSNMVSDTSSAFARVNVRVLVNGKLAVPGEVVFCSRMQQLSSTLQGALLSCSNTLDMSTCT